MAMRFRTSCLAVAVIGPVGELALDVAQAGDRRAPKGFEARHPVEGDLERPGDEPLHFLGARPGILGDDLDERRRRVGIRFDIQVRGRVDARADQGQRRPG